MSKKIQLAIADPCHENWDHMTHADKGRFCASCQKHVVDFTNMSDSQLAAFFKKPSGGSVCGRFYNDQLERDIEIPKKRIPWVKYFFHFALPAFLVSMKATAQGKVKVKTTSNAVSVSKLLVGQVAPVERSTLVGDTTIANGNIQKALEKSVPFCGMIRSNQMGTDFTQLVKSTPQLIKDFDKIKGRVVDEKGEPVSFSTVVIKGTNKGVAANASGEFSIIPAKGWESVVLVVSCVGFELTELRVTNDKSVINVVLQVGLQSATMGLIITKPAKKKRSKPIPLLTQKLIDTAFKFFKVFPNPVSSGASLHIEWKQTAEGYYSLELIDLSGKKIYAKEIWMDTEARLLNLEVPSVLAGNYFLRVTNKQSGKNFTEKIIIQ